MTWTKIDDQLTREPTWNAVTAVAIRQAARDLPGHPMADINKKGQLDALNAKSVHLFTLIWAVPAFTDGRIDPANVGDITAPANMPAELWFAGAELLVEAGAWKKIPPSKRFPSGSFQMVLGWAPGEQPSRSDDAARRERTRLRNRLREGRADYPQRIAATKRARGLCEYCGVKIGEDGGQIDHIDPSLRTNDLENLAFACAKCNQKKGHHSLDSVDMSLTPAARKARTKPSSKRAATRGGTK